MQELEPNFLLGVAVIFGTVFAAFIAGVIKDIRQIREQKRISKILQARGRDNNPSQPGSGQ